MVPAPLICNKLASQECTWKSNMSSLKQKYSPVFPSDIFFVFLQDKRQNPMLLLNTDLLCTWRRADA
jgi:hypothetical protein